MATDSSLGNVYKRLQGVRNISGRRVMPGAEFLEDLEPPEMDVEGTSQPLPDFAQFQTPAPNQPESDMGGELTPQSYDVRANVANPPDEEGWGQKLMRFGASLGNYIKEGWTPGISEETRQRMGIKSPAQTPPIETAQVDMQEGLPPVTASEQQAAPQPRVRSQPPTPSDIPIIGPVLDWANPTKRDQMSAYNRDLMQDAQLRTQGSTLDQEIEKENQELQKGVSDAMQNPGNFAVYGSASEVANHPALQAKFKEITGIDYEPEIAEKVSKYEESMKSVEDALNGIQTDVDATAEGIRQRILNNQSTDADKFYIGLALLMPLIIGGMFGKEAGLGALAGASKGFADVLGGKQKSIQEDEQSLLNIGKEKAQIQQKLADIGLNKAQFAENLRKNLPKDQNAHLEGMKASTWTDPHTGEQMSGVMLKPGLIAKPEFLASKEALTDMRKAANELSETKTYVDEVNDLTDDIAQIVSQLDDTSAVWDGFTQILTSKSPTALAKLSQDIDFEGRRQNAGVLLEEKLGFLANKYGMAQELGQLDRAAQNHIKKIIENPTNSFISPQDSLNQILQIRKLSQKGLLKSAANKGFYPEFIEAEMEKSNRPLFDRLNQREDDKVVSDIERKLSQNEKRYAK